VVRFLLMYYSFSVHLSDCVLRRIMYTDGKVHLHPVEEKDYRWQYLCSDRLFVSYLYTCHNGMYKLNNRKYSLYRKWNPPTCLVTISTEETKSDSSLVCYKISALLGRRNYFRVEKE
jgi:hypothetical protein